MNGPLVLVGVAILILAWAGPLPGLVAHSFAAHMILHMAVVAIAVPVLAIGLAPSITARGWLGASVALPVAVSLLDLVVVWGWHAPMLHEAARGGGAPLVLEQAMFAAAALLLWLVAYGGVPRQAAALSGGMALFFTSMHMTLLGALLALAPRPLYPNHAHPGALADQQLGGAIMLTIGAVVYLGGALILFARVLRPGSAA